MRRAPLVVGGPDVLEEPVTEPTPTTEDGEVIGTPPAPPESTEPIPLEPPPVPIADPPVVPSDEVDPADL
jgi:hypothetical protein